MKFRIRLNAVMLMAACLLAVAIPMTVWGAEDPIKKVSVKVEASLEADGGQGTVSASAADSSNYRVVSCSFVKEKENWKAGEVPKALITIEAEEGYYFYSLNGGKVSVHGAKYASCHRSNNNHTLLLTVKLDPVKGILEVVEDACWDSSPLGKAKWSKVENAPAYELKLYQGETMMHHVKMTTTTNYDFFPYMTKKGDYYFKVRAVPKTKDQKEYLEAGDWIESNGQELTARDSNAAKEWKNTMTGEEGKTAGSGAVKAGWNQDRNGWWYQKEDGSYPVNTWMYIEGKWYLFGMDGYMLTGWQRKDGREYYLTSNGDMVTGWLQDNRQWYYLDPDQGKLSGGWLAVGDQWYFLNMDGSMYTGWIRWQGNSYYLDPADGHMVRDCTVEQHYINSDGIWMP